MSRAPSEQPKPDLRLRWLPLALLVMFLLFFHIVPATLTVFPKEHPAFADTFIDVERFVAEYNQANRVLKASINQSYLFRKLKAHGLVVEQDP